MEDEPQNPTEQSQDLNFNSAANISHPTEASSHDPVLTGVLEAQNDATVPNHHPPDHAPAPPDASSHDPHDQTFPVLTGALEAQNDATVPNHHPPDHAPAPPDHAPAPAPAPASDNSSPSVGQTRHGNSGSGSAPSTTSTSTTPAPTQPPPPQPVKKLRYRGHTFVLPDGIPMDALTNNNSNNNNPGNNRLRLQMLPNGQVRMQVTPGHFVMLEREQPPSSLSDNTNGNAAASNNHAESSMAPNSTSSASPSTSLPQTATATTAAINYQPGAVTPTTSHAVGNNRVTAAAAINGASTNNNNNNNANLNPSVARNIRIKLGGQVFEGSLPAVATTSTSTNQVPQIQRFQLLEGGQHVRLELGQGNFAILNRQPPGRMTTTVPDVPVPVPRPVLATTNGTFNQNDNGNTSSNDPVIARGNHETSTSVNVNVNMNVGETSATSVSPEVVPTSNDATMPNSNDPIEPSSLLVQESSPLAEANNETSATPSTPPSTNSETPALNATSSPSTIDNDTPPTTNESNSNFTQTHRNTFTNQSFGIPNRGTFLNNPINPNPTGHPQIRRVNVLPNGQVQLDLGQGNFVTISRDQSRQLGNQRVTTSSNGNQVNVRVVQINPLTTTPFENSDSSSVAAADQGDDDESLSRFKCAICYHWMKDPVGCGVCSSRFCHACLLRVATGVDHHPSVIPARCPTCRVEFSQASILHDEELRKDIFDAPSVPCKYDGCDRKLQLPLLADHEQECEHALVKCRYVSFGCPWTGKKQAVQHHEDCYCHLAKISPFIEQMRELRGDHSSRLEMVQQQATGAIRMQALHRQNLQREQLKSTSNLFHLFEYCHYVTCATPHFFYRKDSWAAFWRTGEAQGTVLNFLTLLPTTIICLAISSKGYRQLWRLLDKDTVPVELLEEALLCMCIGAISVLIVIAHFVDRKSSSSWGLIPVPVVGAQYMIRDVIALAAFAIYLVIMEYQLSALKAFFIWWLVATGTAFFPGVIAAVAARASGMPPPTSTLSLARSIAPVLFGLRYSLVAVIFDMTACLDAACLMVMTRPWLEKVAADLVGHECFLQLDQPPHYLVGLYLAGARLGVVALQFQTGSVDDPGLLLADSIVAFLLLLAVNFFIDKVYSYGMAMGTAAAVQAEADVRPDGIRKEFNLIGMSCFGVWVATLGALALSG
jgi:hypothetical protein